MSPVTANFLHEIDEVLVWVTFDSILFLIWWGLYCFVCICMGCDDDSFFWLVWIDGTSGFSSWLTLNLPWKTKTMIILPSEPIFVEWCVLNELVLMIVTTKVMWWALSSGMQHGLEALWESTVLYCFQSSHWASDRYHISMRIIATILSEPTIMLLLTYVLLLHFFVLINLLRFNADGIN